MKKKTKEEKHKVYPANEIVKHGSECHNMANVVKSVKHGGLTLGYLFIMEKFIQVNVP